MRAHNYTLEELQALPTLAQGQTDNLKVEFASMGREIDTRVWLARTGVEDGEPYDNRVSIEKLRDGAWVEVESFPGENGVRLID